MLDAPRTTLGTGLGTFEGLVVVGEHTVCILQVALGAGPIAVAIARSHKGVERVATVGSEECLKLGPLGLLGSGGEAFGGRDAAVVEQEDFVTSWTIWPTRLLCPWDFPGKNTGVAFHFLLQGTFHLTFKKLPLEEVRLSVKEYPQLSDRY